MRKRKQTGIGEKKAGEKRPGNEVGEGSEGLPSGLRSGRDKMA